MNIKPTTVRPFRVVIGSVALLLLLAGGSLLYHPVMVWLHSGNWCVNAYSDGRTETLYGDDCKKPLK